MSRRREDPVIPESAIVSSRPLGVREAAARAEREELEDELAFALEAAGVEAPERQYAYVPDRKFSADFAWPAHRLLVEVQGGVYNRKAHGSVSGILRDIERGNEAALAGWRLLRVTSRMISDGDALELIERALGAK